MICDDCKQQLYCGSFLTQHGNEIEYMECPKCGIQEVTQ